MKDELPHQKEAELVEVSPFKRTKYSLDKSVGVESPRAGDKGAPGHDRGAELMGVALGPDWHADLKMAGKEANAVSLIYQNVC